MKQALLALLLSAFAVFPAMAQTNANPPAGNIQGGVETMAVQTMMQASQDNEDDLRDQMREMKKTNRSKATQRQRIGVIRGGQGVALQGQGAPPTAMPANPAAAPQGEASLGDVQRQSESMQDQKDSLGGLGEERQTRIQEYQDRRQKTFDALSNAQKKNSDTQSGITGNLK